MADKKRSESSLFPWFVDGEQPTAAKFNSIGVQITRNLYIIEKSLGDIWSESEPYATGSLSKLSSPVSKATVNEILDSEIPYGRSLDIVNIGRIIGPASKLNPLTLSEGLWDGGSDGYRSEITEPIPSGVYSYPIKYPVKSGTNVNFAGTDAPSGSSIALANLTSLNNEYHIDDNDILYFPDPSGSNWTVSYVTSPQEYGGGATYTGATFNVIPDEAQIYLSNDDLVVTAVSDYYTLELPTVKNQLESLGNDTVVLGDGDINENARLKLPHMLRQLFGGDYFDGATAAVADSLIPEGFVYLKNNDTGEVYTEGAYYYMHDYMVKITGVALNTNDTYSLITVGTDITSSIYDLNKKQFTHAHSRQYGEPLVSVEDLADVTKDPGISGYFIKSENPSNYFPQYLHRDGFFGAYSNGSDAQDTTGNDQNAMRGDFVIGRRFEPDGVGAGYPTTEGGATLVTDPGSYLGDGSTFGLYFGNHAQSSNTSSPDCKIYKAYEEGDFAPLIQDRLIIQNKTDDSSSIGIEANRQIRIHAGGKANGDGNVWISAGDPWGYELACGHTLSSLEHGYSRANIDTNLSTILHLQSGSRHPWNTGGSQNNGDVFIQAKDHLMLHSANRVHLGGDNETMAPGGIKLGIDDFHAGGTDQYTQAYHHASLGFLPSFHASGAGGNEYLNRDIEVDYKWRTPHLKCLMFEHRDVFFRGYRSSGRVFKDAPATDLVYCMNSFPIPSDMMGNDSLGTNIGDGDAFSLRIIGANVMLQPGPGAEFSNTPGWEDSAGMGGHRNGLKFKRGMWTNGGAGGEARPSNNMWDDIANDAGSGWDAFMAVLEALLSFIPSFFGTITGNGIWWDIDNSGGPGLTAVAVTCINVYIGEGLLRDGDVTTNDYQNNDIQGIRCGVRIVLWYED